MRIEKAVPPNYNEISDRFKLATLGSFNPVFAYGDILFNPTGLNIPPDLMVHEEVHSAQQRAMGVEEWWEMYLKSDSFRLDQEVEAYRAQYRYFSENFNRHRRRYELDRLASDLSSALYGNIIKKRAAMDLIAN